LFGKGLEALFPEGTSPVVAAPWPRAARSKKLKDYDENIVGRAIRGGKTEQIDPQILSATQPSVTAPGVRHYIESGPGGPLYANADKRPLYADADKSANQNPVVYIRTSGGKTEHILLSGHHRATAALLKGEKLTAVVARGGFGGPRVS
jgi:hypothetical protein